MKPRQTIKNYHNSNAPPYQHLQNSTTPPSIRDIDLVKLGLNLDDIPNLQANNPNLSNQEEIVKCLQAIYGKNNTANNKLPTLNDWPMQSVSPPDYSRVVAGGGGVSGANYNNNSNNNNNNNNNSNINSVINNPGHQQKQQDIHFAGSQHHPHPPSTINHHFRVSSSNIHSPQQLQLQKSVLSLHHQHHQNDLSNRRLNHHHHMSTTNASFANLNTVNATNATPTSNSSSSLDTNNLSTLSGKISSGTACSSTSGVSIQVPNIIDTLGSMDNMFYDGNMLINKEAPANQQSLIKHQHLQKLLKATGSQLKSSSPSTLSHRNESQSQRNIISNNMPQNQLPISSPASVISPPQAAFTSVPKSLLNLAACSSSSPSANTSSLPSASKFSSMVSQLNLMSAKNASTSTQANSTNNNNATSNIRSSTRNNNSNNNGGNDGFNQKGLLNDSDQSNLLQHMIRSNTTMVPSNGPPATRSSMKQVHLSLLSDDQSSAHRSNSKTVCNVNSGSNSKPQSGNSRPPGVSPKEAYLATLQERAARVGVSIGEISKTATSTNSMSSNTTHSSLTNSQAQQNTISISPNQTKDEYINTVDRKEIESALSRVEARNDLSLLYPPMLLATNSQKQINALSAGLEGTEDSELFTREVKKIVLEECNIIYECKECNNLFRSLANLVKHKRTYCIENSSGRNSIEMNKRSYVNPILPADQSAITINSSGGGDSQHDTEMDPERSPTTLAEHKSNDSILLANYNHNAKHSDRRLNLSNMIRIIQNQEKKNQQRDIVRFKGQNNGTTNGGNSAPQTSLSKLLQSQPKTRLPMSRDNALIGALNMTPISSNENPLSTYETDKNTNISSSDVSEQFVRNSSLAKTLLNEKVRATNTKQSLCDLSKVESTPPRATKRAAPKRKFLEDCIQKVKRDKLLNEEEDEEAEPHMAPTTSYSNAEIIEATSLQQANKEIQLANQEASIASDASKFNSPSDSDDDSDMLTIDLDGPTKRTPVKKAKTVPRRISTAASSTASSTSSIKLNTSSALLKALTRPVDTKRPFNASAGSSDEKLLARHKEPEEKLSSEQEEPEESLLLHEKKPNESLLPHQIEPVESLSPQNKIPEESLPNEDVPSDSSRPLFSVYTCDICKLNLEDPSEMLEHSLQTHSKEMIIFPCVFCSFRFISIENVCRHILEIHKKPRKSIDHWKLVVLNRTYKSNDFSDCRDFRQLEARADGGSDDEELFADDGDDDGPEEEVADDEEVIDEIGLSEEEAEEEDDEEEESYVKSSSSSAKSFSSNLNQNNSQATKTEQLSGSESPSPTGSVLDDSQSSSDDDSSPQDENAEQAIAIKQISSPYNECDVSPAHQDNDSHPDSEGIDDDSISSLESDEQKQQSNIDHSKQSTSQRPSPSSRSNPEPSTSSAGSVSGSGGIMKLKIQLKTRPDEKSKVYEIV